MTFRCRKCDDPSYPYSRYNRHEYICHGNDVHIDLKINNIIEDLWAQGFKTFTCCEGDLETNEAAYIAMGLGMYLESQEIERVYNVVKTHMIWYSTYAAWLPTIEYTVGSGICFRWIRPADAPKPD